MKIQIALLTIVLFSSCSHLKHQKIEKYGRSVSSQTIQRVQSISDFLKSVGMKDDKRFQSVLAIYEWREGSFVGFGRNYIEWGHGSKPRSFKFDKHDTILQVELIKDFLLVRTHFGILLKIKKDTMQVVQTGFPVASFEYLNGIVKLYNKNGPGRFCDQEELKRPIFERDPSCELVAVELVLD